MKGEGEGEEMEEEEGDGGGRRAEEMGKDRMGRWRWGKRRVK